MPSTLVIRVRIQAELYHLIKEKNPDFNLSEFVRNKLEKEFEVGRILPTFNKKTTIVSEQKPKPTREEVIREIASIIDKKLEE